jgi:Rod binding domain-containing protein
MRAIGNGMAALSSLSGAAPQALAGRASGTAAGKAGGLTAGPTAGTDPRLAPAAHQFEASLMKELLEPLQRDPLFADEDGSGDASGASGEEAGSLDTLKSLGTEALAQAIAERGGLGIAAKILQQIGADPRGAGQASRRPVGQRGGVRIL